MYIRIMCIPSSHDMFLCTFTVYDTTRARAPPPLIYYRVRISETKNGHERCLRGGLTLSGRLVYAHDGEKARRRKRYFLCVPVPLPYRSRCRWSTMTIFEVFSTRRSMRRQTINIQIDRIRSPQRHLYTGYTEIYFSGRRRTVPARERAYGTSIFSREKKKSNQQMCVRFWATNSR